MTSAGLVLSWLVAGVIVGDGERWTFKSTRAPHSTAGTFVRTPAWPLEARLFGSDQTNFWSFGNDVALDGNTSLVGAPGADIGGLTDRGAAYVFVRQGGAWPEQAQLLASDGGEGDRFGTAVAIQGDTAVVGAAFATVGPEIFQGAVFAYVRSGDQWTEEQKLTASDGDAQDRLGFSVALDGDTIIAGARSSEAGTEGCQGPGAAYVFVKQGGAWIEQAKLFDPDGLCSDGFGNDVALQGDTALIGADNADNGTSRGAAYVFTRTGGTWTLEQKLLASDGAIPDQFGTSVALDRDAALIGAELKEINGNLAQGAAYVFRGNGTSWVEEQRLTASDGHEESNFGMGAALLGDVALVGAERDFPGHPERGVVYEFRYQGGSWVEIQSFPAPMGQEFDLFGRSISLTSERVLISNSSNVVVLPPGGTAWIFGRPVLFSDGFESGDATAWDQVVP